MAYSLGVYIAIPEGNTLKKLENQHVLVTGASSGFGRAIALACAAEGASLSLVARREAALREVAALAEAEGVRAVVCVADVADEAQILAAVQQAQGALGPVDVLVNNAGTNVMPRTIQDTSSDQWRELLTVNLTSAFLFTKAVLPQMQARQQGTIINVSSRAALHPSLGAGAAYSTSKMGMDALTQITNQEANPHNIRACQICPGTGNTPIIDRRPKPPSAEERQIMLQPEDVAATVVFVAALPPHVNIELVALKPTRNKPI